MKKNSHSVVIPVALTLLLGPGIGQFYNKEFKKGFLILGLSVLLFLALIYGQKEALLELLPSADAMLDLEGALTMAERFNARLAVSRTFGFYACIAIFFALWIYSILDAYWGALRRSTQAAQPAS